MTITIDSPTREGTLLQLSIALAQSAESLPGVTFTPTVDAVDESLSVTFTIPLRQQPLDPTKPAAGKYWQAYDAAAFASDGSVKSDFEVQESPDTVLLNYDISDKDVLDAFWVVAQDVNAAENAAGATITGGVSYTINSDTQQAIGTLSAPLSISLVTSGKLDISAVDYLA